MKQIIALMFLGCVSVSKAELIHQFRNPSFGGGGWSSHSLTVDSIERSRRDSIEGASRAEAAARLAAEANTPLNRFISLFQSQVYAQLATQLSNNLFQNRCQAADGTAIPGCVNPDTGIFQLDGNTITWLRRNNEVRLTVIDSQGSTTTVVVPIASFGF